MGDLDRDVTLRVQLDSGEAEQSLQRFGETASKAARDASGQVEVLARQMLKVGVQFHETGRISTQQLASIGVQLKDINRNVDQLTEAERKWLTEANKAYATAIKNQREYNEQLREVRAATQGFTSLHGLIDSLAGPIGKVASAAFLMYEAFKLGWQIGEKLNEQFTKYLPNWTKSWDDLAASVLGYEKNVKSLSQVLEDPKYGFTAKTQAMAGQIASREAAARQRAVTQDGEVIDYGSKLMEAYYTDRLRKQQEANRKAEAEAKRNADALKKIYEEVFKYAGPGQQRIPAIAAGATSTQGLALLEAQQFAEVWARQQAEVDRLLSEITAEQIEAAKKAAEEFNKALEDAFLETTEQFAETMSSVFTAGMIDGAEGFARAASGLFVELVGKNLTTVISKAVKLTFGAPLTEAERGGMSDQEIAAYYTQAQNTQQAITQSVEAGIAVIGRTLDIMRQARLGQAPSVAGTAASYGLALGSAGIAVGGAIAGGAAGGAALGGIIGAAVGLIVGAVVGILAKAKAKLEIPYGRYGIRGGEAFLEPYPGAERQFEAVSSQQRQDMLAQLQHSFEDTRNAYVALLLKFHKGLMGAVLDSFKPTIFGFDAISNEARKQWLSGFQAWVEGKLPREIADEFFEPLAQGFQQLGISAERFKQIWDRLQDFDPSDAVATLNNLFDALTAFQDIQLTAGRQLLGGPGFEFGGGWLDNARAMNARSFAEALDEADANLIDMGETMSLLIGPEQVAAAKEWGDALLQRQRAIEQFFQQIASTIDQVIRTTQKSIRDLQLQGMVTATGEPDINAQITFLKKYADDLWGQITRAATPEQATALWQDLMDTILKINQLGQSFGGSTAEAYRLWAIDQLQRAQDLVTESLNRMAQDVADRNEAFLAAIDDFIDAFRTATGVLTGEEPTAEPLPRGYGRHPGEPGYGGAPPGPPMTGELHVYVNGEYSETVVLEQSYVKRTRAARGRR
jgi:hypothetical protein